MSNLTVEFTPACCGKTYRVPAGLDIRAAVRESEALHLSQCAKGRELAEERAQHDYTDARAEERYEANEAARDAYEADADDDGEDDE